MRFKMRLVIDVEGGETLIHHSSDWTVSRWGVTSKDIALLATLHRRGIPFTRSLTIGRQSLVADASGVARGLAEGGASAALDEATRIVAASGGYAEPVFAHLGAECVESLD